jgi:DNA-directed RNA polymerase specialized sigma subunit
MNFNKLFTKELPRVSLDPAREQHLIHRLPDSPKARESLALESMWEAVVFLRSCACAQVSNEELFSLAWDGLTRAVKNYKPRPNSAGFRFFTYAKCYLRGNLRRFLKLRGVVRNATGQDSLEDFCNEDELIKAAAAPMVTLFDFSSFRSSDEAELLAGLVQKLPKADQRFLHWKFVQELTDVAISKKRRVHRQAIDGTTRRIFKRLRWMVHLEKIRRGAQ